ncbi:MAG: hypothetical protein R3E76_01535 [Planctomycetota bacterium]
MPEDEITKLERRLAAAEFKLASLERRVPTGWRGSLGTVLLVLGATFGLLAYFGPAFGAGPVFFNVHKIEAWTVQAVDVQLEDPDDPDRFRGEIEGRNSSIEMRSDAGEISISPEGIFISGPDGEIELRPEKKKKKN